MRSTISLCIQFTPRKRASRVFVVALCAGLLQLSAHVARAADADAAEALRARYAELQQQLIDNGFKRPLHLESRQNAGAVQGDIHALVEHAFADVRQTVLGPTQWCEILILHLNVKDCKTTSRAGQPVLVAHIGRKRDTTADAAHRVDFAFAMVEDRSDYLQIGLSADSGPLGTRNYKIKLEATTIDAERTFVHLSYSYVYGPAAALALKTYMNTVGAAKVGFTVVNRRTDGTPVHVGDVRGAIERNAMRYFLAIDACVSTVSLPSQRKLEERVARWFDSTERYALQLHEIERHEYLSMKLNGAGKQQASQASQASQ